MQAVVSHEQELRAVCQQLMKDSQSGRVIPPAGMWLLDNYSLLQSQARELREALSKHFWRKLGGGKQRPRIYDLTTALVDRRQAALSAADVTAFFEDVQRETPLSLAELWAIGPVIKLALLDAINEASKPENLEAARSETVIRNAVITLRALNPVAWDKLVESLSRVEAILQTDPAGVYPRMDFETRDAYRRAIEELCCGAKWQPAGRLPIGLLGQREAEAASKAIAQAAKEGKHVGEILLGPSAAKLRRIRYPGLVYFGGLILLTSLLIAFFPAPWWIRALLAIPFSQIALSILHPLINRIAGPRRLPRLDFSKGIADDCKSFVVIPTLLLSRKGVEHLIERIEIHYLANRDPNLLFGLLTDFADAPAQHTEKDAMVDDCIEGIRGLNERYGSYGRGPFYLFHRDRQWNGREGTWMGHERKRGKLDDFNEFLLGKGDAFATKKGNLNQIAGVRYVITLDTDTQLPRDSARELVATMAHPLNRPVLDEANVVRQGYALLQPRVSVSMESARRSRLANLYSGQTGLDPYTKAVSDVYQDLFGQASYTGKGIYELETFARVTRGRFPENTLLSHDLIEGEHVRVGLVTDIEVIDDFPTTYEAFSKRKHRWVRGDWQIAMWLLPWVPDSGWNWKRNPLSGLSRWKIFDNLRRSTYEISLLAFFTAGLFGPNPLGTSVIMLGILAFPAFSQAFFTLIRIPPVRFWGVFLRETASQFLRGLADALVQLTFLLHQALLMSDAIVRTLIRRFVTKRKLLEWESAAQAESGGGALSLVAIYLLACPAIATLISFFAMREESAWQWLPVLALMLWAGSPLTAEFLSQTTNFVRRRTASDAQFLRGISLRTWRYFAEFNREADHWLVPDNVQEEPWLVARRSSPTNMGLQLAADVAARDFGYLTHPELADRLENVLGTLSRLERNRGHFYNWYDTTTLQPLPPRYISGVDSGNLAAALITVKQSCIAIVESPLVSRRDLDGLRDHCELLRQSLPHEGRTAPIMRQLQALAKHMEGEPNGLYHWEGLLSELHKMTAVLAENVDWLCEHWKSRTPDKLNAACHWMHALQTRVEALLGGVVQFAPWLSGSLEQDVRMLASDARMQPLMTELSRVPKLGELPALYHTIKSEIETLLRSDALIPAKRRVLEEIASALDPADLKAVALIYRYERCRISAAELFEEMDFRFLLDEDRMLMRIGFDVETETLDDSHYDLLASEARTAVFLAVAKGDFPREAWFRLGRRLCSYAGHRTLLSWSGTMFEYLMPALFLRTFEGSLLGESLMGAVRIQQAYCRAKGIPWGVSEAAHSTRDAARNYQYRAFGVPVMAAKRMEVRELVVAPYATMLALPVDPYRATLNLRNMVERGWLGAFGFFESIDYMGRDAEIVRAFMVHHQGMAFIALANALLDNPMPRRFHSDPMVLATELLLQERLPVIYEETPVEERLQSSQPQTGAQHERVLAVGQQSLTGSG